MNNVQLPATGDTGSDDFSGHKVFENTDNLNRVDWKIYSRQQQMMVKQFKEGAQKSLLLDWDQTGFPETEDRLSQLATWVALAEKNGFDYQLRLSEQTTPLAHGQQHFHLCLESLALHP
jgi:uncharacterized protein (DUF58 family)